MKKIFTLLTLALVSIGTAWGEATKIYDGGNLPASISTTAGESTTIGAATANTNAVLWYGRGSATIDSNSATFSDAVSFTKSIKTGGKSTYKSGSSLAGVLTFTPSKDGILKVYAKGGGKERSLYVTQSAATSTENDATIAIASVITGTSGSSGTGIQGIAEAFVEKDKQVVIYVTNGTYLYGMTFEESNSDLALSATSGVTGVSATTSFTYTTSSTGTVTVASSDEAVATATVNTATNTVTIEGVAAGAATITVTQDADASYGKGVKKFTVTVNESVSRYANTVTPTGTLDLSNAGAMSTMLNGNWDANYGRALYGNDGANNIVTFSFVGAYSSTTEQTWVGAYSSSSTSQSWDAIGVFKGASAYGHTRAATTKSDAGLYSFRVKGASKVQALVSSRNSTQKVIMAAYAYSGSTLAETTILYEKYGSGDNIGTLTLNLNAATEYLITISADGTSTNSRLYEMALFYDESVTWSIPATINSTYEWATFVSPYALDFTSVSTLKAYIVTGESGDAITKTQMTATVPAGTPLLLNGATSSIPVAASSTTDVSANKLKAGTGNPVEKPASGSAWVLSDYIDAAVFKYIDANAATVPVGKAYLLLASDTPTESRTLALDGEATAIKNIKVGTEDNIYYDLNGRRVLYPTKGLYIVNGKKVILK